MELKSTNAYLHAQVQKADIIYFIVIIIDFSVSKVFYLGMYLQCPDNSVRIQLNLSRTRSQSSLIDRSMDSVGLVAPTKLTQVKAEMGNQNPKIAIIYTSRRKRPMMPRMSPAAPINPIDSPNNKEAKTATVRGCESIMTCNILSKS